MKKVIIYFCVFMIICFCVPALFINKFDIKTSSSNIYNNTVLGNDINKKETDSSKYEYNKYGTIKLLNTDTNTVEEIELDKYLYSVVSAEMPANFHLEALKAQAVVARTYTIYKIQEGRKHEDADICSDSNCCQAWISKEDRFARWEETKSEENWNKIVEAVNSTAGDIVVYNNKIINAFFHSNSGGSTEIPLNVWGGADYPYLQVVETAGENEYSQYSSEANFTKEEFKNKMQEIYNDFEINFEDKNCFEILEYTDGSRVKKVRIGNKEMTGVEVRKLFGLKSARFVIEVSGDNIIFSVIGYGHGVGMSQTGADYLASNGYKYDEIIKHFYKDVQIIDLNSY